MTSGFHSSRSGNWPSWVSPDFVAGKKRSFSELRTIGGWILWQENRPYEKGRTVIVGRAPDGSLRDLVPEEADIGTSVHEYGGGAWAARLTAEEHPDIIFSDRRQGGVWHYGQGRLTRWSKPSAIVERRYADLSADPVGLGVFCVRETHADAIISDIVHIAADGTQTVLASGEDFYAAPRPSPDGRFLAWFSWRNPQMPWTRTRLHMAVLERSPLGLTEEKILGGEERSCSIIEPRWADPRTLYATSDESGLWTPIRFRHRPEGWQAVSLPQAAAEIGLPHWVFGQRTMAPLMDGSLLALGFRRGVRHVLHYNNREWQEWALGMPVNVPEPLPDGSFAWIDSPPDAPAAVVCGRPGEFMKRFHVSFHLPAEKETF